MRTCGRNGSSNQAPERAASTSRPAVYKLNPPPPPPPMKISISGSSIAGGSTMIRMRSAPKRDDSVEENHAAECTCARARARRRVRQNSAAGCTGLSRSDRKIRGEGDGAGWSARSIRLTIEKNVSSQCALSASVPPTKIFNIKA